MATHGPHNWQEAGVSPPSSGTPGGLIKGRRRVLVRGFRSTESGYGQLTDGYDGRFFVDDSLVNEPDDLATRVRPGDIVVLLGEFDHRDEPALFIPTRVVRIGVRSGNWVRVWSIADSAIADLTGREDLEIPRSETPSPVWAIVQRLAMSGEAATDDERQDLLALFGLT